MDTIAKAHLKMSGCVAKKILSPAPSEKVLQYAD